MDQPSSIPRPSGIPRPASRLPVLKSSNSQSRLRPPSSAEQLRKKPSISSLARPGQAAPALQKKTSRASLVRSNTPSTSASAASSTSRASLASNTRRVSGIPSFGPPRASTTPSEPVFKRPFARPPSRQTNAAPQPPAQSHTNKEEDALGSLNGFRSASRASSRAGSRAGFRENDEPEYVLENDPEPETATKKKSRPSLSERTIESLSQLPSSPAASGRRRRSSFFNADNSMPPPLRPASAMSSNGSRPTTSDGTFGVMPATPKRFGASSGRLSMTAPGKRSISANVITPATTPSRTPTVPRPASAIKKQPLSLAQNLQNTPKPRPLSNSKSMVARTPKTRPSLSGTFGQAISPPGVAAAAPLTPTHKREAPAKRTPNTVRNVSSSSIALREQIAKAKASRKSELPDESGEQSPKVGSSSNTLREQIAKAKEAARRAKTETVRTSTPPRDAIVPAPEEIATFDFGLDDPFNQQAKGSKSLLRKRIDGARVDGRLNMAAMGLKEIPAEVLDMYKYDPNDTTVAWGDIVDLTSIIAADNELEDFPEAMFPDVDINTMMDSDEGGPQFGGIQNMDLHGNSFRELPLGLRRLTQLSRLNLSRNKLPRESLDVISQITSLRELRLAENDLQGELPSSICNLTALEVLELQGNKLTCLPDEVQQLVRLRTLNVSDNQLRTIPMGLFQTRLIELIANKNRLEGYFFTTATVPYLQELNVSNNSLTRLCEGETIDLPTLKLLNVSTNRLTSLPNVDTWINLHTLIVAENKLTVFPEGFTALPQIRTADFTANDISHIDERIALMPLEHLTLAANPLRERKFLTMAFDDIKRDLASRLPAEEPSATDGDSTDALVTDDSPSTHGWSVTPSGTLDLSSRSLTSLDPTALRPITPDIRNLYLPHNAFQSIPAFLSTIPFLTVLDLSNNTIATALTAPLSLPKLKDLRLSANNLASLTPLITHLDAPALTALDVSANRLTAALPPLRTTFPALTSLLAADNALTDVDPQALTGLKIVNLANNDIERLEPRIGLLAGSLTSLNVEGNRFRVPSYHVLQRGTEAVLTWLRDKIPRESWRSDGTEFFDAEDGGAGVGAGTF